MNFQRPAIVDVKSWMARADELVKRIEQIVARNPSDVMTQSTMDPQHDAEVAKGVVELGYRDARHFCESFPAKFQVNQQFGFISLRGSDRSAYDGRMMNWNKDTKESRASKAQWDDKYTALSHSIMELVCQNMPDEEDWPNYYDPESNRLLVKTAKELGFRSVREFCESYPQRDKFYVNAQNGRIGLVLKAPVRGPKQRVNPRPVIPQPSIFSALNGQDVYLDKSGAWVMDRKPATMETNAQSVDEIYYSNRVAQAAAAKKPQQPTKTEDKIHFKLAHGGVTRRFALSRMEKDLLSALKAHVLNITGTEDVCLFWKDEDSLIVLDCEEDMGAAIDYAQTQNKLACVTLETGDKKQKEAEAEKAQAKVATAAESAAAFNGFSFMCDACDAYLAPSSGGRYKCTLCDNYDLCAACIAKGEHDNHAFVLLRDGNTEVPLKNEAGGVLSMITKDAHRCTPTFIVKSGERLSADKIFIDVIDSVGKHVGKKMYDTAEWLKKEAEKMNTRREEAEVEEQKMVEEIIRREHREQEKRHREEMRAQFVNADKQAESRGEDQMRDRMQEMNLGEAPMPSTPAEVEAKLFQTMKDRKIAEQMWREEKKHWRDTRKHFKKEEKALRKENKHHSKFHRMAERSRQEEKPEEKKTPEQIEKEEQERKERYMQNPVGALIEELLLPAAKSMQAYVTLDSDVSSDDSDVELLEKPVEKTDSIVSDLVVLDDQAAKQPAAAAEEKKTEEQQFAAAVAASVEQPQQQQPTAPPAVDHQPQQQQAPIGFLPQQQEMPQQDFVARHRAAGQSTMYPELPPFRTEVYEPFNIGRGVQQERESAFAPRRVLRPEEIDELYARAHRIPTHMEIAVLSKLQQRATVEELKAELDKFLHHLKNNTHSRLRHSPVLSTNPDVADDDLIRMIAVDLMARLQSMKKIVHNATPAETARMIENRLLELNATIKNGAYDDTDALKAAELFPILLTSAYTGRFGFSNNPFQGNMWGSDGRRGFGRRSMHDRPSYYGGGEGGSRWGESSRVAPNGWNSYLPGFMQAPAANAAHAAYNAASAATSAAAATAAAALAPVVRSPTASAPAAEQQLGTADMNMEQKKVLRQLFETGMFEDYDRMVEVCRRAATLEEAIDMMLQ